jgi:hypothetical protein
MGVLIGIVEWVCCEVADFLFSWLHVVLGQPAALFLCGFRPMTRCAIDQDSRCQPVQIGTCSGFTSTAFQEFGLTQVYAQVSDIELNVVNEMNESNDDGSGDDDADADDNESDDVTNDEGEY